MEVPILKGQGPDEQTHGKPNAGQQGDSIELRPCGPFRFFAQSDQNRNQGEPEDANLLSQK